MGYQVFKSSEAVKEDVGRALKVMLKNMKHLGTNPYYETFKVIRVGRCLQGEAFYHEVDEHYTCIGFEVEIEYQYNFDGRSGELERSTGFYALWVGESHEMAPFTFDESYRPFGEEWQFNNGMGDHFEVHDVLATIDEVKELI